MKLNGAWPGGNLRKMPEVCSHMRSETLPLRLFPLHVLHALHGCTSTARRVRFDPDIRFYTRSESSLNFFSGLSAPLRLAF